MVAKQVDTSWMWHPDFAESRTDTAGLFVHFRRRLNVEIPPVSPLRIQISADTRYKLYANSRLIACGPVKGDQKLWFYDEVDLSPYLRVGENNIAVQVLRFFHATSYASSFPRLLVGGLMIKPIECGEFWTSHLQSSNLWETAIDSSTTLPTNLVEDDFLHIYEAHNANAGTFEPLKWTEAKVHKFQASTGLGAPWKLSPRMIPALRVGLSSFTSLHNIKSSVPDNRWEEILVQTQDEHMAPCNHLALPARTSHCLELEVENHTTAFLRFIFQRPEAGGSVCKITYAESYENPPILVPYLRSKEHRRDYGKALYGPQDVYTFHGAGEALGLGCDENEVTHETFSPFHFRTFRFIKLEIDVGSTDLVLEGIKIAPVNYPLDVSAHFDAGNSENRETVDRLWTTSIRTLSNCMHDCYEDCPFYEQLQYAMDMRSSALFTYYVSGDDRLARQALTQIHHSYEPRVGLTSSRAPCHQPQLIPHFSLYWICAVSDHYTFFSDRTFIRPFMAVIDGVLEFFNSRIDPNFGLVSAKSEPGMWDFTDWTNEWRPYGIPPAAARTGFSTYTNCLYIYTLKNAATILRALGRSSTADEYTSRANVVLEAVKSHCFDGAVFTDGLARPGDRQLEYSVHSQVFAVLCGAASGSLAQSILRKSLSLPSSLSGLHFPYPSPTPSDDNGGDYESRKFTQPSLSMSFYTLRALALAGPLYTRYFDAFLQPWRDQLALGLTTWEEDSVSQRSDCHTWGSAPIYEFMAEVAGVYPAAPGWTIVGFRPRLELFGTINARVPVLVGQKKGWVWVWWQTEESGDVRLGLKVEMEGTNSQELVVPVTVSLPDQAFGMTCGIEEVSFVVKAASIVSVGS
ncbi:hypothetical protein IFR05_008883 [Cadophora sp. M221]|nr:hypothetical protein IFR05_008883 [Cadophora sp. M221]